MHTFNTLLAHTEIKEYEEPIKKQTFQSATVSTF